MNEREDILPLLVQAVAAGDILLHDDRQNLVSKQELTHAVSSNRLLTEANDLIEKKLVVPVDQTTSDKFHVAITFDFLEFNYKLVILGFPLRIRQKIADMYYPLFWALCSDIDYEVTCYKEENGREPSHQELAYLRVINEWAVANSMGRIEDRILRFEPEGDHELQQLLAELARKKGRLKRKASFGFQENEIEKAVKEIWLPPFRYFQGREIKAFIDIAGFEWTREESKLLWGGHFDFALFDSNAVLQLVIEYNGGGHYGRSEKEKQEAQSRDKVKKRICEKAAVPIFTLTSEFAFVNDYREMLKTLLFIFRMSLCKVAPQFLHDRVLELLHSVSREQTRVLELDMGHISEVVSRLDVYRVQERADMLLALLWEAHFAFGKRTELASILNSIKRQIGNI